MDREATKQIRKAKGKKKKKQARKTFIVLTIVEKLVEK